jgi:hypothetical protein
MRVARLLGRKIRVSLGNYPQVSLQAPRAQANHLLEQAKLGINPKLALGQSATAHSLTVRQLSERYLNGCEVPRAHPRDRKAALSVHRHRPLHTHPSAEDL